MRSYMKDGLRIGFTKETSTDHIEALPLEIARKFELLSGICDNRSIQEFPAAIIKEIVEMCNDLRDLAPHYNMPEEYVEYVRENKDVLGYFEESENNLKGEEMRIINKRRIFDVFRSMMEKMEEM
ncbi:uncharacterized protein Eint_050540 [Encephalitozoon intestinalis ATCC 50506]|uniref:Mediator of RNA polymerase II transcription subunit 10 n=1 Tax=Encephalitozoon intestinalis (strain ATCC 50506) TaxID=876142 RepID=E0S775_ENCIT|nr:uncharacterized protein Eint_050540 [Encephalitozoon intestinalis ATCC 50506]ADM11503.1 hypothetical protein Eint_050540 [Encephalitozoon intestinalis ATCC 50506]UTX45216.1 hypothetical protein GPK93_05g07600 [Encephalitozoon intestinalis]